MCKPSFVIKPRMLITHIPTGLTQEIQGQGKYFDEARNALKILTEKVQAVRPPDV